MNVSSVEPSPTRQIESDTGLLPNQQMDTITDKLYITKATSLLDLSEDHEFNEVVSLSHRAHLESTGQNIRRLATYSYF
jgi:hypothetical protein